MPLSLARAAGRCVAADYRDEAGGHDAVVPGEQHLAVYRSSTGTWFWRRSSTGNTEADYRGFGIEARGDVPVPGDYDGDGKTVRRP